MNDAMSNILIENSFWQESLEAALSTVDIIV